MLRRFDFGIFGYKIFISKSGLDKLPGTNSPLTFLRTKCYILYELSLCPSLLRVSVYVCVCVCNPYGRKITHTHRVMRGRTLACAGAKTYHRHLSEDQSAKTLPSVLPPQLSINKHCTTYLQPWAYGEFLGDNDLNHISTIISLDQSLCLQSGVWNYKAMGVPTISERKYYRLVCHDQYAETLQILVLTISTGSGRTRRTYFYHCPNLKRLLLRRYPSPP